MDTNRLIEMEKPFVDELCDKYNYDSNIRNLLYLIVLEFILNYGNNI